MKFISMPSNKRLLQLISDEAAFTF